MQELYQQENLQELVMRVRKSPETTKSPDMPLISTISLVEGQAARNRSLKLSAYGVIDMPH